MPDPSYMGLYDPRVGGQSPIPQQGPGVQPLDPSFGMGPNLYSGQPNVRLLPQPATPAAPAAPQDPWALLQPKLDAYLNDWFTKKYASALGADSSRQEVGAGAGQGSFEGAGNGGAGGDRSFESGSAGFG